MDEPAAPPSARPGVPEWSAAPVRVEGVELHRLALELAEPLVSAAGTHRLRPLIVVRLLCDLGEGWGECAALAAPTYTEEYADGAEAVLAEVLVPRLLGGGAPDSPSALLARLAPVRGHHMAKAALEMALLDVTLRAEHRSLASFLGATRTHIPAGATVGRGETGAVLAAIDSVVAAGYRRVKVKIAPGHDVAVVEAARAAFPGLALVADANGSYRLEDRAHRHELERLDDLGLVALEQPLAPDDLVGHARLAAALDTPVLLDESLGSSGALESAIALGACDGIVVKPARLGGLLEALAVHDRARAAGLHLAIGGMLESGLGRAATVALGACAGFDLPGDLGASARYFADDLTAPHELSDGSLVVPDGPGLGVGLLPGRLAASRVRSRLVESS